MRQPALPKNIAQLQRGARIMGHPEPGFFTLRLVKGGPLVPALIWRPCPMILPENPMELTPDPEDWGRSTERPRVLRALIGDREVNPHEVWERGTRIGAAEYHWRRGLKEYAVAHAPHEPEARPHRRPDLGQQPSLF